MKPIIDPIPTHLLEAELTHQHLLRKTNKGGNELYIVTAHTAPNVMREIGRLREMTFRAAGGGTGNDCDIDRYDTMENPCRQLIVWDPEGRQILGGYRYLRGSDMVRNTDGTLKIATAHLFRFSERFISDYLPHTIELGRSFVRPDYQSSRAGAKAIFTLDNLWDGLGSLTVLHPETQYLFGKVTMYPGYHPECHDLVIHFLHRHFPDPDRLVEPLHPLKPHTDPAQLDKILSGTDYRSDYHNLNAAVRAHGVNIPPLVNAYMSLSPTMKVFGTAVNDEFGNVNETGILVAVSDIVEEKKARHINTYVPNQDLTDEA